MKALKYIIPLILALLGFLIYSNILYTPFIFDDEWYIVENHQIRDISNFLKDFSGTRYIGLLSFAINYYFGGLNTFGYHLVNVIIHIINAILVYILVSLILQQLRVAGRESRVEDQQPIIHDSQRRASDSLIAFSVSLLFLVHPIQTQAVSYITQRFTSLAAFFYLLAIVLYVKGRVKGEGPKVKGQEKGFYISLPLYLLSIFFTILAMKTKEISFTIPFMITLCEFTFFDSRHTTFKSRLLYLLPFFITLMIIPLTLIISGEEISASETLRKKQLRDIENLSIYNYFLTQFRVILTYIRILIFPANQNLLYDYPLSNSIFEPATFLSFLFLLSIFSFTVYLYFRSRKTHHSYGLLISFGILWFFTTLSVESSVIPIKDVIFEHRLYLPSIGFILSIIAAAAYGFSYLEKQTGKPLYNYFVLIIIVAAAVFSFSTHKRNILWGDKYMMWSDVVNKSPNMADAHYNLGKVCYEQSRFAEAIQKFNIVLRLKPDHSLAHYNLGIIYHRQKRLDEAIKEYLAALKNNPNHAIAANIHYNLGNIYSEQDNLDKAIEEYLTALRLKPDYAEAHYNLGNVYYDQKRLDEAIKEYLVVLKIKSDHTDAYYNLGLSYLEKGLKDEAKKEFASALKLKPDFVKAKETIELIERMPQTIR